MAAIAAAIALASCTAPTPSEGEGATTEGTATPAAGSSLITVRANGEAFVQEGLTSRDGWQVTFDRLLVGIQDVVVHQTEPPFDAQAAAPLAAQVSVPVPTAEPVNLKVAEGAELPAVGQATAAPGRYNALSWHLAPTVETEGGNRASILLAGQATKDGRTVPFTIAVAPDLRFECGDYVGDERKGVVTAEGGELEITLHFDHWFGDASLAADDPMNQESLGIEPLIALAQGDRLTLEPEAIAQLPAADQETLTKVFNNLAHVGEGHCRLQEN
ncbi:MAG: DUF4382 domain-containing protein [Cyanobacteria bacterium]|nr:DUF4382 domain-containing protein [Cyanobacteriota bacterium]